MHIETYQHLFDETLVPNLDLTLRILQAGDGYVIVDKPAGMPVMPLRAQETHSVLNALICHYPELQGIGEGGLRSGVVHRLDTDTSGALIVATQEAKWQQLRHTFKTHQTEKRYRAIVQGQLEGQAEEVVHLYVAQHKPAKVRVRLEASKDTRLCKLSWKSFRGF